MVQTSGGTNDKLFLVIMVIKGAVKGAVQRLSCFEKETDVCWKPSKLGAARKIVRPIGDLIDR